MYTSIYILYRIDNQELKIILCVCLIVRSLTRCPFCEEIRNPLIVHSSFDAQRPNTRNVLQKHVIIIYFFILFHVECVFPAGHNTFLPFFILAFNTLLPFGVAFLAKNPDFLAVFLLVPRRVQPMDRPPAVMTKAPRPLLADGATCLLNAKTDAFPTDFFADKDRDDADVEVFEVDDFKLILVIAAVTQLADTVKADIVMAMTFVFSDDKCVHRLDYILSGCI